MLHKVSKLSAWFVVSTAPRSTLTTRNRSYYLLKPKSGTHTVGAPILRVEIWAGLCLVPPGNTLKLPLGEVSRIFGVTLWFGVHTNNAAAGR